PLQREIRSPLRQIRFAGDWPWLRIQITVH
ncbi:MAG: hypothetical protein ACI9LY_003664, partial [Arenicella sp.]